MDRSVWFDLARNLRAGLRLALFLPVDRLNFRIDVRELVTLTLLSAALDIGNDFVRYGDEGRFSWLGVSGETYAAGVLLLAAALLSLLFRQRTLALALPTIVFASYPPVQVLHLASALAARWLPGHAIFTGWQDDALLGWTAALFLRAAAVALIPVRTLHWPRALLAALVLLAPLWFGSTFAPDVPWWRREVADSGAAHDGPYPASEPVMEAQRILLDEALTNLDEARPGVTDLYFVGFASGGFDALRSDVLSAVQAMDQRWGTAGRSLALVNSPATVLERPMATVSNLRETLAELEGTIDPDEDVVMLYIAGKGARGGGIEVVLPPFEWVPLTPAGLRQLLDDAGIRWRIVVVTACHAGDWLEALTGDEALVMVATDAAGDGEGCAVDDDGTAFGSALFGAGIAEADTLDGAFEIARKRIAERAARGGRSMSGAPQMVVGPAMAGKLRELERGRAAQRASHGV